MIREKRDSRLTADISETAHELLKAAVIKFDSSKGKLVEKMIHNFLGGNTGPVKTEQQVAVESFVTTVEVKKPKAPKAKRKQISYPSNLDEQFLLLWDTKGKKGSKQKAYDKFRKLMANDTDDICEQATMIMVNDINANSGECGYPELHLISYLNQARWEK